jgi:TolB protein
MVFVAVVVLGGLGALALAMLLRPAEEATPAPNGGRIATIDAAGALVTMDPGGGTIGRYALDDGMFRFPAYSPDASTVAVIGVGGASAGVYLVDGDAATATGVVPEPAFAGPTESPIYLYWAPDGASVMVLSGGSEGLAIHAVRADGSVPATRVQAGSPLFWDWVDGSNLLVHVGSIGSSYLGEVPVDGGTSEAGVAGAGRFQAPGISASERYRAYTLVGTDPGGFVVIEERETGTTTDRIPIDGPTALGWSPAADQLAYITPGTTYPFAIGDLSVRDAATATSRTIRDGQVVAFFWSPDGRSIAAMSVAEQDEIAAAGGGAIVRLSIVEVATGAVTATSIVRPSQTFLNEVLPYFDQYALSHRIWSPASDALVLSVVETVGTLAGATIIPADGGVSRRIADAEVAFWSP